MGNGQWAAEDLGHARGLQFAARSSHSPLLGWDYGGVCSMCVLRTIVVACCRLIDLIAASVDPRCVIYAMWVDLQVAICNEGRYSARDYKYPGRQTL